MIFIIIIIFLLYNNCAYKYEINQPSYDCILNINCNDNSNIKYLYIENQLSKNNYSFIINNREELILKNGIYKLYYYSFTNKENNLILENYKEIENINLNQNINLNIENYNFDEITKISYKIENNTLYIYYLSNYETFNISSLSILTNNGKTKSYDKKYKNKKLIICEFYNINNYIIDNSQITINISFYIERNINKDFFSTLNYNITTKRITNYTIKNNN